jgi:hypothetical protein
MRKENTEFRAIDEPMRIKVSVMTDLIMKRLIGGIATSIRMPVLEK